MEINNSNPIQLLYNDYTALGPLAPLISIDTAPPIPVVWIVGVPTESLLPLLTDFLLVIREQQQVQGIIIFDSFYLRNYKVLSKIFTDGVYCT